MIEVHPFGNFVPPNSQYLVLGSFPGKLNVGYHWFFSGKRNQFWPILQEIYQLPLDSKVRKQRLFAKLKMAMADIILSCERKNNSNLDNNLINIVYNTEAIADIIRGNSLEKIFFTSRFVESTFYKLFKDFTKTYSKPQLIYLPSPSPRYAAMGMADKISRYRLLLPTLPEV